MRTSVVLPAPLGPKQAQHPAIGDNQANPIQGTHRAEGLVQALDSNRRRLSFHSIAVFHACKSALRIAQCNVGLNRIFHLHDGYLGSACGIENHPLRAGYGRPPNPGSGAFSPDTLVADAT